MILTPEIVFRKIECIHPDYLKAHGITALVLDVDNTLTGDNSQVLEPTVQAWLDEMRAAGISLTIVSNLSLIHISEPTRRGLLSRMPSSA